jgi:outer membrane usher protein
VYVNNLLSATQRVQQGPFTLNDLPNISGRGEIRLVVRDLLGREQSIVAPLYGSNQLLKQGLNDFAFQAGTLRERLGTKSADYGRGFASGIFRTGVSDKFTFESAFEFARGRYAGGLGATWLMGFIGEFSASAATSFQAADTVQSTFAPIVSNFENPGSTATSGATNRAGQSFSGSWDWRSKDLSVGIQTRFSSAGFRTIFSLTDTARPLREISSFASFGSALGSFGLGYVNVVRENTATNEYLQLNWSGSLGRSRAFAQPIHDPTPSTTFCH